MVVKYTSCQSQLYNNSCTFSLTLFPSAQHPRRSEHNEGRAFIRVLPDRELFWLPRYSQWFCGMGEREGHYGITVQKMCLLATRNQMLIFNTLWSLTSEGVGTVICSSFAFLSATNVTSCWKWHIHPTVLNHSRLKIHYATRSSCSGVKGPFRKISRFSSWINDFSVNPASRQQSAGIGSNFHTTLMHKQHK